MDLQRLVIDDPDNPITIDFHPGLTVAIEAQPGRRHRLVEELVAGLGRGRSGVHLELLDARGHALVVFRPADTRHRVIDTEAGVDLTTVYACPDDHADRRRHGRVDLLWPLGVDASSAAGLLRLGANQLDAVGATDDDRRARHLAALDQSDLWTMAEQLTAAEARRNAAVAAATGAAGPRTAGSATGSADEAAGTTARAEAAVDAARALQLAAEAHARSEAAAQAHRGVLVFGGVVAAACLVASAALVAFDQFLDDNRWTAKVLVVLGLLAMALALWDRRGVRAVRRHERRLLASLGAPSYEAMRAGAGPLADEERRRLLLDAASAYDSTAAQWRLLTGGASLHWALEHRPAIAALAERRQQAAPFLATDLAREESALADSARLLVERVGALRHVGPAAERLPLVLDEPFIGLDAGDTVRLLETVRRLAAFHQVLLVTGNEEVEAWATRLASSGQLSVVRPGFAPGGDAATSNAASSVNAPS